MTGVQTCALPISQLDRGQIAVAVGGDKAAPAVVPGAGQGQGIPIGGQGELFPLEKPTAQLAAHLGAGPVIGKAAQHLFPGQKYHHYYQDYSKLE